MSDYSIFPTAIDGYAQLPLFVDNITPVNAEGLNRIRSAIINIENALGIIPQGEYQTVSERLDNIDSGGLEAIVERLDLIEAELDVVEATLADFPSDLATVLAAGNITGGSNIILSTGDRIEGESSVDITANSGDINLTSDKLSVSNGGSSADLIVSSTNPNGLISGGAGSLALDTNGNLFVGQGGTSWNALANRFDPINSVFDAVTTLPELYNFLAETDRPDFDTGIVPATIYVDSVSGSDTAGDGSAALPFATFKRAYQVVPSNPTILRTIRLQGPGPYNAGGINMNGLNYIIIEGDEPPVEFSRTITSIGASSDSNGLILDDTDAALGVDAHRGRLVKFTSGVLNGQYGVIIRNAANQVEVTQARIGTTFNIPSPGDTYDILDDWITVWDFPYGNNNIFESCGGSGFTNIKFEITPPDTSCLLFINDTGKFDFLRCRFEISTLIAGRGGSFFLNACSVANKGSAFSDWGMVSSITQGIVKLQNGTLIDGINASAANSFISGLSVGMYESQGEVAFRDLGPEGIVFRQSGLTTFNSRRGLIFNIWRFIDCQAGVIVNNNNEGWGWGPLDLPDLHGNILGTYSVQATGGARVRLGANSTVTDAGVSGGITTVSADDGATESSENSDGTLIVGGIPASSGFALASGTWPTSTGTDIFGDSYEAASVSATDGNIVLSPNGTGAIQAQIADGASSGGDARGDNAVDLQTVRSSASQVASGEWAVVSGGSNNTAGTQVSVIGGGFGNEISGGLGFGSGILSGISNSDINSTASVISGGNSNSISGSEFSFIGVGGLGGTANANRIINSGHAAIVAGANQLIVGSALSDSIYNFIGGGASNTIGDGAYNCKYNIIIGGTSNQIGTSSEVEFGTVLGGARNFVEADYGIASGKEAVASHISEAAHASGYFATEGDAQFSKMVLRAETSDATPAELSTTGFVPAAFEDRISLSANTAYRFRVDAAAREDSTGDTAWWEISGCIKMGPLPASTALIGSLYITNDFDAGASSWALNVTADTANDSLKLEAVGENLHDIRWVATAHLTKVSG